MVDWFALACISWYLVSETNFFGDKNKKSEYIKVDFDAHLICIAIAAFLIVTMYAFCF
jgi:hypothetical protein